MRRSVKIQLLLFALTSVIAVVFGIGYSLGPQSLRGSIEVRAHMIDAMGMGQGTGVTYRGVSVGTITAVSLSPDGLGADVAVSLDPGTRVPIGSVAKVTGNSALGLQTLDIMPTTDEGPYLTDGGTLDVPPELQPRKLDELLTDMARLADSIDPRAVTALADTMADALNGTGPALAALIADADTLSRMLDAHAPALAGIIDTGLPMLDAVAARSDALAGSAGAARDVTQQLVGEQPSLIYLLDRSPAALDRTRAILDDTRGSVGALLTNLVSVTGVLGDRTPALAAGLVSIPATLGELTSVVHGDRGDFTLVATQGPVCWYDTPRRTVGDQAPRQPDLNLYCPPGDDLAQRGSQNAPRPDDLGLAGATQPGNVTGPPMAQDPILIPTGVDALGYWQKLLEGVQR